jgi:hypothetical protein
VQEPIYQMQMMDGKWIDQAKQSYEYNKAHGHTVRIVYTTPPAQHDRVRELECVIADLKAEYKELLAAQPAPVQPVESWEDLHNALQRIDTAAVGLPTFEVRHEGGLDAVVQNIVDAIVALYDGRTTTPAQPAPVPLTDEQIAIIYKAWQAVGADIRGLFWSDFVSEITLHEAAAASEKGGAA